MTQHDLKQLFERYRVHPMSYSLLGELHDESTVLEFNGEMWEVYYYERGGKSNLRQVITEDYACRYMLAQFIEYDHGFTDRVLADLLA